MKLITFIYDAAHVSVLWALVMGLYWVACRLVDESINGVVSACLWIALFVNWQMVKFDEK